MPRLADQRSRTAIFADASDDDLLGYGVPVEWLDDVRAATEDSLLDLADHLPGEAAEALLQLATGGAPARPAPAVTGADPFAHPDAQRRFRVMADVEALERALEYPWEKWTVFLHPAQRQLVEREYRGPARVAGSAGTGKTIVALHRAVHLARTYLESRVLLATFSDALAAALRLVPNQAPETRPKQREGYAPQAIGVFVRSLEQIERALSAVQAAGMRSVQLDDGSGGVSGSVAVGTMHLAKGLEFRAVAVAACDEEVIPLQARLERVGDDADLEEVYGTERHLLYVACTRARDRLLVTGVDPGSEFLDDLRAAE